MDGLIDTELVLLAIWFVDKQVKHVFRLPIRSDYKSSGGCRV